MKRRRERGRERERAITKSMTKPASEELLEIADRLHQLASTNRTGPYAASHLAGDPNFLSIVEERLTSWAAHEALDERQHRVGKVLAVFVEDAIAELMIAMDERKRVLYHSIADRSLLVEEADVVHREREAEAREVAEKRVGRARDALIAAIMVFAGKDPGTVT